MAFNCVFVKSLFHARDTSAVDMTGMEECPVALVRSDKLHNGLQTPSFGNTMVLGQQDPGSTRCPNPMVIQLKTIPRREQQLILWPENGVETMLSTSFSTRRNVVNDSPTG